MKRVTFCMTISVVLFFSIFFTAGNSCAGPSGVVKVALAYDPTSLNMLQLKTGIDLPVVLNIHQALQSTDHATGKRTFRNSLTRSAEVLENGKDIKFVMTWGNFYHTGDPVTAHDVKFTYEQCVDISNANVMAGPLDEIEEIEILDDYSFIFRFYEPYAAWRELLWIGICSKNYYEKAGKEKFGKHPVGSGFFRFVSRKIGESVTLEAYEKARWMADVEVVDKTTGKTVLKEAEQKIEYKTLKFIVVPDDIARLAMLETGEVDLVSDILPHNAKRLERNKRVKVKREDDTPSLFGISAKPDNFPIFKEYNFTMAFSYAINRQEIVDKIFLGEGYPLYMFASKSELGYDPDVVYEFDPDKARELVKKSSYKPGTPIILTYTSAVPNAPLVAATIQEYMKNVGVTIKLQQLEAGVQATYSRKKDPKEGHLTLYSWAGGRDPSNRLILTMPSTSIYCAWTTRPSKVLLDDLVMKQAQETDRDKRLVLLKQMNEILRQEPGGPVLFGLKQIYAHTDRIEYEWLKKESFLFSLNRIRIVK